jgi:hypothetical protein
MKAISYWARRNPTPSILIIILLHFTLAFIWLILGVDLYDQGILLPAWMMNLSIIIFLVAVAFYPVRGLHYWVLRHSYWRQKTMDLTLLLSSALMIICYANQSTDMSSISAPQIQEARAMPIALKLKDEVARGIDKAEKKSLRKKIKEHRKKVRQEVRETVKMLRKQNTTVGQIGLVILILIAAGILLYLLAALACSLSCSGNEGAATLVLLFGTSLLILGVVLGVKAVFKKNKGTIIY